MSALLRMDGFAAATGPWLAGHVVDLTALRLGAVRAAANHAVDEAARPTSDRPTDRGRGVDPVPSMVRAAERASGRR